ncbi:MAG: flagellar hook-associated protein FlgK [Deltaproteobacteria bacterium]|nr:flagellar hook-associated protein FlgK [Deltaproteobacteria bacterium]
MSINGLFNIGKSALFASQTQLSITSNNIANASTPGYSRQEVILEIATTASQAAEFQGGGVSVAGVKRLYDRLLQNQINSTQQDYGQATTLSETLAKVEQIFNETQDLGLAGPLKDFFNAWQGVASNPAGLTERNLLLQKSDALVLSAQRMENGINAILRQIQEGITGLTDQINSLASKIARLNDQIIQIEAGSSMESAGSLRDQRETALKDLSNLVELSYWEDKSNGSLTVTMGMKTLVDGNSTSPLSAVYNDEGDFILQLDGQDITSRITKGEMGGLLTAHQEIEGTYLHDLRTLVASVTNTVNLQHASGFDLDGSTNANFFNPLQLSTGNFSVGANLTAVITDYSQLTLGEYEIQFNGANFEVYDSGTGALKTSGVYNAGGTTINLEGIQFDIMGPVTDLDRFTVSPLTTAIKNFQTALTAPRQIAASGTATSLPGDNTNALALADLSNSQSTALDSETFANYYQGLVGQIGTQSRMASDELTFQDNFLTGLTTRRDAASGVNMDEEAANLIRYQRAYEAAARLIRTADEIFQTLLNL